MLGFAEITGLIGAAAWIPWLVERLRRPKLFGRLISELFTRSTTFTTTNLDGSQISLTGIGYILKLSFTTIRRPLHIQDVEVLLRYSGDPKQYRAQMYYTHQQISLIDGKPMRLRVPHSQFLQFLNYFPIDVPNVCYAMFVVDKATFEHFSDIEFRFRDWRRRVYLVQISASEIDVRNIVFEEGIWEPVQVSAPQTPQLPSA